jgi:heptosyltransferase-2
MIKKFLILRFSSLGDVALQIHFCRALKEKYPQSEITFISFESFFSILENETSIDHALCFPKKKGIKEIFRLAQAIKKKANIESDTLVIDLHGSLRSKIVCLFLFKNLNIRINKRKLERLILVRFKINLYGILNGDRNQTQVMRVMDDFSSVLGVSLKLKSIEHKKKSIVLMPSAAHEKKRWSVENFKLLGLELLKNYPDHDVFLLAGPEDDFCLPLEEIDNEKFHYLQGKSSLRESIEIIKESCVLIGNDTGLCHIAELHQVPVVMIMGPTHESFGFAPLLTKSALMTSPVWCRPCHHTGAGKCFREQKFCLTRISVESVLEKVKEILQ